MVHNANYLVFLNCHACGREFMADAEELAAAPWVPDEPSWEEASPKEPEADPGAWLSDKREKGEPVFLFCPMCGELAAESAPTCEACGEPLPTDRASNENGLGRTSEQGRRFRRHARWLGLFWILMAYLISPHDYWVGGTDLALPPMIMGGNLALPEIPLLTSVLVGLGAFALVGQFWAVAVAGLFNYLILFVVVWRAHVLSLCLLAVSIVLTHVVLHQASGVRFR